jgi:hypothetical protein
LRNLIIRLAQRRSAPFCAKENFRSGKQLSRNGPPFDVARSLLRLCSAQ